MKVHTMSATPSWRGRRFAIAMLFGLTAVAAQAQVTSKQGAISPGRAPEAVVGSLTQSLLQTVNGDVTAAGVGLRASGAGNIALSGLPAGATVVNALLYWAVIGNSGGFNNVTFAGQAVNGNLVGTGGNLCWGFSSAFSYRANVTALVTANGSYSVSGLPAGQAEGASLVVMYTLPGAPARDIVINDGMVTVDGGGDTYSHVINNFNGANPATSAHITYLVADGQAFPDGPLTFNGNSLGTSLFVGSGGDYWDTLRFDVTAFNPVAPSSTTLSASGDCLGLVASVFSVEQAPEGFVCNDLAEVVGDWGITNARCGNITSNTTTARYESARFDFQPANLRGSNGYAYEVEFVVNRPRQPTASTSIFVAGSPLPLRTAAQNWDRAIAFNVANGRYSIYRYNGLLKPAALQQWAIPVGVSINAAPASNTMRVESFNGQLLFSINGVTVRTLADNYGIGQFGVGFVRSLATTGNLGADDWMEVLNAEVSAEPLRTLGVVSPTQHRANEAANAQRGNGNELFAPASPLSRY